ncbi:putative xylogalacturonan beta-1,3-xylosyltransferase [Helianthus annuus]|nr:putative xylogalacturonan beta-1,3-xylosyltransferase [Helianthus annuus]
MKLTKDHMGNCIRSLCNSNLARGFKIGKDATLPATNIRSAENPVQDLGGNPPSKRPIFAFFAGGMHGNLRPILVQTWFYIIFSRLYITKSGKTGRSGRAV